LYYLCGEVSAELAKFVETGKRPEQDKGTNKEYHVFTHKQEKKMIERWTALGFTVTYHRHQIELTDRITITYMKVQKPQSDMGVSLIPWFMVAGRPYPIFAYVYAIGHYQRAEQKSLEQSAAAVRKLFGIGSFHKSTVSRSISAMTEFINKSKLDRPMSIDDLRKPGYPTNGQASPCQGEDDTVKQVSEVLNTYPSLETLESELGETIKRLPDPIKRKDSISHALSKIPDEQFKIIIRNEPVGRQPRDGRKRPPRPRAEGLKSVQRPFKFVDHPQQIKIRQAFITICCHLVLNAAVKYHRFLI
jgi:hypothetical protein